MKRIVSVLLLLALAVSMLAGCSSSNGTSDSTAGNSADSAANSADTEQEAKEPAAEEESGEPAGEAEQVTIRYYDWDIVDMSIIDQFMEENPDIIVEVNDISANSDRATQLDILAMSGDIDVMPMADGDQFARFEQGMLTNLDELIAEYGIDMEAEFGDYAEWAKMGDSYYAIPYRATKNALYYNKEIFDQAGVAYPTDEWTLDDYIAAAEAISAWGADSGIYGAYSHTYGNEWAIMGAQAADWYTEDGLCNIKDPVWVRSLELRNELDSKGLQMPYSEIKASGTVINSSFLGGKEGMVIAGSWLVRDMKKTDQFPFDFEVGVSSVPRFNDSVEGVRGNFSVSVLGIPETSKNKEAAFRFITYLETKNAEAIAATGNVPCYIPAYTDELIETFAEGSSLTVDQVQFFFDTDVILTTNKILGDEGASYMSIIKEEVEPYFFGEVALEDALDNIESRVNELLTQ